MINQGKSENIKANKKLLKEDRFRQYNEQRSKHERDKIKKLMKNTDKLNEKKQNPHKDQYLGTLQFLSIILACFLHYLLN